MGMMRMLTILAALVLLHLAWTVESTTAAIDAQTAESQVDLWPWAFELKGCGGRGGGSRGVCSGLLLVAEVLVVVVVLVFVVGVIELRMRYALSLAVSCDRSKRVGELWRHCEAGESTPTGATGPVESGSALAQASAWPPPRPCRAWQTASTQPTR